MIKSVNSMTETGGDEAGKIKQRKRMGEFVCPAGAFKQCPTSKSFLSTLKSSLIMSGLP